MSELWLDWFIGFVLQDQFFTGAELKGPNTGGPYSTIQGDKEENEIDHF